MRDRHSDHVRLLVRQVKDYAIITMDTAGRALSWNKGVECVLGFDEPEFLGRDITALIFTPEDVRAGVPQKELEEAAREGAAGDDRWMQRKDGTRFWANGVTTALRNEAGELAGFCKILRDATGQKQIQEALMESEQRKAAILDSALDCIITIDHESTIVEVNRVAEQLFGYTREEMLGQNMAHLIIPERYREAHFRGLAHYLATGVGPVLGRRIELSAIRKDGSEFPVELGIVPTQRQGKPLFTGTLRDITERKLAEEALQTSERRFRAVFNQQFQFMAVLSPEGRVLEVNENALKGTGFAREEVLGKLFWETPWWKNLPEMRSAWPGRLANAAKADGPVLSEDLFEMADGAIRVAEAAITAVKRHDGTVDFFIAQGTEITERKRHAEELEKRVQERTASLRESFKALETLLYTIAHDLRAPNRAMQGYAQLLLTDHAGTLNEDGRFLLGRIAQAAVRNEELIRDLLEFGRLAHVDLPRRPLDPKLLVATVVASMDQELRAARAEVEVAERWPKVLANDIALSHVLTNLLSNAIKYVAPGVPPRIRIFPEVAGNPAPKQVRLCVEDNGIGIAPEYHERIFEPFQRASTMGYEGTGMGLAIVRKAVERMGGSAGVRSGPGKGSCFWVELLTP